MRIHLFDTETNLQAPFVAVKRINIHDYSDYAELRSFIHHHCVERGEPLVIENLHRLPSWNPHLSDIDRLCEFYGTEELQLYDMKTKGNTTMTIPDLLKESYNSTKEEAASPVVKSIVVNPPVVEPPVAEPSVVEPSVVESPVVKKKRGRPPRIASASVSQEPLKTTVKGRSRKNAPAPVPQEPPQTTVQGKKRGRTRKNAPAPVPQEPLQTAVEEKNLPKAEARRIYAKDLTCPPEFETYLKKIVPDYLLPLGTHDLFGCMPPNLRAENLMCYLGGSYTGTALHRDICGTFGHNIMLHTAPDAYSEWLLIEHRYRDALANVTHPPRSRVSGQKSFFLDSDRAWCSRHMLKKAGIKTHVIIQKLGDMVLIPSLCYHQVRNVGFSAKIAWNRATPHTLMAALDEHLPIYRSIVRPEVYRCKAMVCYALRKWLALLKKYEKDTDAPPTDTAVLAIMPSNDPEETSPSLMDLPMLQGGKALFLEECRILLHLLAKNLIQPETIETIEFEEVSNDIRNEACNAGLYTRTCDFCRSDIFFRYYHCSDCSDYDLCMNCYIRGRSCKHVDKMTMQQSRTNLNEYIQLYRKFIECVNNIFEKKCLFKENLSVVAQQYSLATSCRRLELYRAKNKCFANHLVCGHCHLVTTLAELYQEHSYDIQSIFGRRLCWKLVDSSNKNAVYTCESCTKNCSSCSPLVKSPCDDILLNYYLPPYLDNRNWGAPVDEGLFKSYYWPDQIVGNDDEEPLYPSKDFKLFKEDIQSIVLGNMLQHGVPELWQTINDETASAEAIQLLEDASQQWGEKIWSRLRRTRRPLFPVVIGATGRESWYKSIIKFVKVKEIEMVFPIKPAPEVTEMKENIHQVEPTVDANEQKADELAQEKQPLKRDYDLMKLMDADGAVEGPRKKMML